MLYVLGKADATDAASKITDEKKMEIHEGFPM